MIRIKKIDSRLLFQPRERSVSASRGNDRSESYEHVAQQQNEISVSDLNKEEVSRIEGMIGSRSGYLRFDSSNAISSKIPAKYA